MYVANRMCTSPHYGSVVLNKLLYYIDNTSFVVNGHPISDFVYVKQDHGPTPSPRQFVPLKNQLIEEGHLHVVENQRFGKTQKRLQPTIPASEPYSFSAEEIVLIDEVIGQYCNFTAKEIEDISHEEISWKVAATFEELPYNTYLLTEAEIDHVDIQWAKDRIRDHKVLHN
jgi:uncharacterized phage-associated protein